ncbi:hypothetical protein N0V82_006096 [Gnomoniopsis sp. IMI 355080]|nr:hypothetical protein N0V82_006096 [Gnomoniopsis sp. IMI 355080]
MYVSPITQLIRRQWDYGCLNINLVAEGKKRFDWAIVLGATNDIGVFAEVDDIMAALKETWSIPLSHGCKVLAVTVPRATIDKDYPQLVQRRSELNQGIREYKADGFHVFDLHDVLPCDQDHARFWDDAIHFTPAGYDFIGDKIGEALTGIILSRPT